MSALNKLIADCKKLGHQLDIMTVDNAAAELTALRARIAELTAALNDCRNFADDAMGEWSGIQPPYLPAKLEGYFDIVGTVDDALKGGTNELP